MDVDQRGLVERHGLRQHASKVLRAGDGEGRHARRPGPGREVGIVGLAVGAMIEGGADLATVEVGILQVADRRPRSEEHTSELQSLMRKSYAVFCLKKKTKT